MIFFEDLYLGETVAPKKNQILKKLNKNDKIPDLYLITISMQSDNMLDLIPQWEVLQKGYPKDEIRVVGLANGKKEAMAVVQIIVEQSMKETGSADVREFLKCRWEEQS